MFCEWCERPRPVAGVCGISLHTGFECRVCRELLTERNPLNMGRLLRKKQIAEMLAISIKTVDRLVGSGKLPKPIYVGEKSPRWHSAPIEEVAKNGLQRTTAKG